MPHSLDYERPAQRREPRPRWDGVLAVGAIGLAFVAWGKAASARGGPLPGELLTATVLVVTSIVLSGLVLFRLRPLRKLAGGAAVLATGVGVAGLFNGLAIWHLIHCRW